MRHFIGDTADSPYPLSPRPPRRDGDKRCVRVEAGSSICVSGASWRRLEALGMTEADRFLVVDDSPTGETTDILVPGFGICQTKNESIIDVLPMSPSTSGFNLASLQCGIDRCEPETLWFLSRAIGHTLVRLKLCIGDAMELSRSDASAFVCAFPVLEYLDLNHVSLGSMNVLLGAYETRQCRVSVLSLTNSYVDPPSMTRFAMRFQDPLTHLSQCLRELRFLFEDYHESANGSTPGIITLDAAAAFCGALRGTSQLTFLDLGLTQPVYNQFFTELTGFDKAKASVSKVALLSVLLRISSPTTPTKRKKAKRAGLCLPTRHHHQILSLIWSFMPPAPTRVVSVICVPRE